jgi:N-acetylglutamate synthase-like GNAT family acetyltransferase
VDGEVAELRWGMVRKDLRGNGLGRFLLMYRLREIGKAGVNMVRVADAGAAGFFEKQGFRVGADGALWKKLAVCE